MLRFVTTSRSENEYGKWQILVRNRVRIWRTGRHTPTKNSHDYPPRSYFNMRQKLVISSEPDLWLLQHTDEPQRGRNSCLWLQSRSVLSSFGVVLMSCRLNFHVVRSALQYSMVFCLQNLIFLFPGAHQIWWAPVISQPCLRQDAFILSTLIHFILHEKLTNFSN